MFDGESQILVAAPVDRQFVQFLERGNEVLHICLVLLVSLCVRLICNIYKLCYLRTYKRARQVLLSFDIFCSESYCIFVEIL
jgi:hypothetical protein